MRKKYKKFVMDINKLLKHSYSVCLCVSVVVFFVHSLPFFNKTEWANPTKHRTIEMNEKKYMYIIKPQKRSEKIGKMVCLTRFISLPSFAFLWNVVARLDHRLLLLYFSYFYLYAYTKFFLLFFLFCSPLCSRCVCCNVDVFRAFCVL